MTVPNVHGVLCTLILQSKSDTYEKCNICASHAVIVFIHHSITPPLLFLYSFPLGRVSSVLLMCTAKSQALRNERSCACIDFREEHKPVLNSTYLRTGTTVPHHNHWSLRLPGFSQWDASLQQVLGPIAVSKEVKEGKTFYLSRRNEISYRTVEKHWRVVGVEELAPWRNV